ncbi:MAG: ABC transporter ATP-binding protein [Bradymonadales bacterium]|nr:ABC transporter ATP-binding protein [Bradymonadales bacterium]
MIEARTLTKRYGPFTAVRGIDLDVFDGEVYGFLGPNGAGKTTTLQMLAGMIRPSGGSIRIGGHDLATDPLVVKRITSFIPDRPYLYERLTAVEFLRFVGGLYRLSGAECAMRAEQLLDLFELSDWAGSLIENFSHGMKQRLVFAAALLPAPRLLVVDEPTVGLDPKGARLIKQVFKEMCHQQQATVFLSTHSMEVAEELCDRISVIHRGEIVATGTLRQLQDAAGSREKRLEEIFLSLTEQPATRSSPV